MMTLSHCVIVELPCGLKGRRVDLIIKVLGEPRMKTRHGSLYVHPYIQRHATWRPYFRNKLTLRLMSAYTFKIGHPLNTHDHIVSSGVDCRVHRGHMFFEVDCSLCNGFPLDHGLKSYLFPVCR